MPWKSQIQLRCSTVRSASHFAGKYCSLFEEAEAVIAEEEAGVSRLGVELGAEYTA